jgi:methylenetetrahydrofolate reductase (NADPH)
VCAEQVIDLVDRSVTRLHFYTMNTMNRADLVFAICHLIGLRTRDEIARPAAASSLLIAR